MRTGLPDDLFYSLKTASFGHSREIHVRQANKWLQHLLPDWADDSTPDAAHPHRRRFTQRYRRKQGIVKNVWIVSGAIMILNGALATIIALSLATTFLSFMILDETP